MTILDSGIHSEVSIRIKPGAYVKFPVIDNKDLFDHYHPVKKDDGYELITCCFDETRAFGIYRIESGLAYLIAALTDSKELTSPIATILLVYFPWVLHSLDADFSVLFPDLKYEISMDVESPYACHLICNTGDKCFRASSFMNMNNLTPVEMVHIKQYPGAEEYIKKVAAYVRRKTEQAFK